MDHLSSSDNQSLIYSILILVFLISGLLSRRDISFAKTFKYLAIWSLLALIMVVIYSYRFEFSDLKNRLAGELKPASARINENNQIVINLSSDGHFYIDAKVNSYPLRFMIDTGASDIVINKEDAIRVGINPKTLIFNRRYETANGAVFGASINIQEIEIAGVKFSNIHASVNSANMGMSLLGMSFLRQFRKYEFYQDRLVLTL